MGKYQNGVTEDLDYKSCSRIRRLNLRTRQLGAVLTIRIDSDLSLIVVSTLTSTTCTDQLPILETNRIQIRARTVLGEEMRPIKADAGLRVHQVLPKPRGEGSLHSQHISTAHGGGRELAIRGLVHAGRIDDLALGG